MSKLYIWLSFQLIFSSQVILAQHLKSAIAANPTILSASSSEQNLWGGLSFSIGATRAAIIVDEASGTTATRNLEVSNETSEDLGKKALRSLSSPISKTLHSASENVHETAAVMVTPNPFVDRLTLFIDESKVKPSDLIEYTLFDIEGNVIETAPLLDEKKEIMVRSAQQGAYMLVVYKNGNELVAFTLLKKDA